MKASLLITLTLLVLQSQATVKAWTTKDLNLNCQGQITLKEVGPVEHKVKWLSTRLPEPQPFYYTLAPVKMQFISSTPGCAKAQSVFELPFTVKPGEELWATISQHGHVTHQEMLILADVNTASSFQIKQHFYSATKAGELPVFPLYHSERIDFVIQGKIPQSQMGIPLSLDVGYGFSDGDYFANYKFLDMGKSYGIPSPQNMTVDEKYQTVQKIMNLVKSSDLKNPEVIKILNEAINTFAPNKYSDFEQNESGYIPALKKHLDLVVPFLNQLLLAFPAKGMPKEISHVYGGLQQKLDFDLFLPFGKDPADARYAIYTLVKMPVAVVVSTGNAFSLKAEEVEQFLSLAKGMVLAHTQGSAVEAELAPYVGQEKTLQIKAVVQQMLNPIPGESWKFPLTEMSKQLIEEILK